MFHKLKYFSNSEYIKHAFLYIGQERSSHSIPYLCNRLIICSVVARLFCAVDVHTDVGGVKLSPGSRGRNTGDICQCHFSFQIQTMAPGCITDLSRDICEFS